MPIEYNTPVITISETALLDASVAESVSLDASVSETPWLVGITTPAATNDECMYKMTSIYEEKEPIFDEDSAEWGALPEEGI